MNIHYAKADPHELLKWVTWETQCLLDLRRENQAEIDSAQNASSDLDSLDVFSRWLDTGITLYRRCIPLIGNTWGIKSEAEAALLGLRESAPTAEDGADTWTPVDEQLMKLLWGLFETCIRLGRKNNRKRIYRLAQEITDFHGLDIRFGPCAQIARLQNAQELQAAISKEAVALLTLFGTDAEVQHYKEAIRLIQKAWEIPDAYTQPWVDAIDRERTFAEQNSPEHVFPEEELLILETEEKTLDNIWRLFETAVRLPEYVERNTIFNLAVELSQIHNLPDQMMGVDQCTNRTAV